MRPWRTEESRRRRERRRAEGLCIDCPQRSERYQRCLACRVKMSKAKGESEQNSERAKALKRERPTMTYREAA